MNIFINFQANKRLHTFIHLIFILAFGSSVCLGPTRAWFLDNRTFHINYFHLRRSTLLAVYTKINIISNKITDRGSINYNKFPVTNFSRSSPCSNKAWSCSVLFSSQFIEVTCCFIDSRVEADQDKLCGFLMSWLVRHTPAVKLTTKQ